MIWPSRSSVPPSHSYYRALLRACVRRSSATLGEKIHTIVVTTGLSDLPDSFICNALLQFYAAYGRTSYARKLFDKIPDSHKDAVDWTTVIGCFASHGFLEDAFSLFTQLLLTNLRPDGATMSCLFNACGRMENIAAGSQIHVMMVKLGLDSGVTACNSLMDMFIKSGLMEDARRVFQGMRENTVVSWTSMLGGVVKWEGLGCAELFFYSMPERNEVSWTIMAAAYVGCGFSQEALSLLNQMIFSFGYALSHVTLSSILSGCSQSGSLMVGKWVHVYVMKYVAEDVLVDVKLNTTLLDMYAKCGRVNVALKLFEKMPLRNTVTWNSMISGLAMDGQGEEALRMFYLMRTEADPDDLTFTCVLNACSHSGLVDHGFKFFHELESVYGIKPKMEHYACMVDLLGRAGRMEEADLLLRNMPFIPNKVVFGSLLGACSVHSKLQLGKRLIGQLNQVDPENIECHILLSNMYAKAGNSEKSDLLRQAFRNRHVQKIPGMSAIHVGGILHRFTAGDRSHPQVEEIYDALHKMIKRLQLFGYVPDFQCQVHSGCGAGESNAEELEDKEQSLFYHSEKLAVCFGILKTKPGVPLYIFKNIRICSDCHCAMKVASRIYTREIVIRDRNRFHRFNHGSCSCSDFW